MKKILLPTDFSDNSWNAIGYALKLYADEKCMFFLMNSYMPPLTSPTNSVTSASTAKIVLEVAKKNSEDGLAKILKKIKTKYKNSLHQFKTIAKYDFFLNAVKEVTEEKKISLIVMGTKGASGLKEALIGSNTAGVIGKIPCPLLAIPEKAVFGIPKEIAFATDYSHYYSKTEIALLLQVAKKYKSAIRVLHTLDRKNKLSEAQEEVKNHLQKLLKPFFNSFHILTGVALETAVRVFIESREITMLCMVGKHHNFFERILGKPRVEEISFHIKVPFLVLHEVK